MGFIGMNIGGPRGTIQRCSACIEARDREQCGLLLRLERAVRRGNPGPRDQGSSSMMTSTVRGAGRLPLPVYSLWRRARLSRWGRALAGLRAGLITDRRLARHAQLATMVDDPSYASEWPYLRGLLTRLAMLDDGFAVDIAAGDGVNSSTTLPLFRDHGWRGLAVECDPARFSLLRHAYRDFAGVATDPRRVTPDGVADLLRKHGVPLDFQLLNLDIDSFDLDVVAAILAAGFRPLVIDMEVNEKIPPPVRFAVRYSPTFEWDESHFYGCSLAGALDVLSTAGYRLEGLQYNNAFFVRDDVATRAGISGLSAEEAYRSGYAGRSDRRTLFPWNADMEDLLACDPCEAVTRIGRRFARRHGFLLQLEPLGAEVAEQPSGTAA